MWNLDSIRGACKYALNLVQGMPNLKLTISELSLYK